MNPEEVTKVKLKTENQVDEVDEIKRAQGNSRLLVAHNNTNMAVAESVIEDDVDDADSSREPDACLPALRYCTVKGHVPYRQMLLLPVTTLQSCINTCAGIPHRSMPEQLHSIYLTVPDRTYVRAYTVADIARC
ncbi:hypothetical protein CBL_06183 [Carabus blaptoides fortunei]